MVLRKIKWLLLSAVVVLAVLAGVSAAADQQVVAESNSATFTPNDVDVAVGDTVTVSKSAGGLAHNVHYDDGQSTCPASPTSAAWSCPRTFSAVGDYAFHCDLHTFMTGTVHVRDPDAVPPASSASSPALSSSASITVGYSASDGSGWGVKEVELWVQRPGDVSYSLVATDTTSASPTFTYTANAADGLYRFYTRARDKAGNYEDAPAAPPDTSTVLDTTPPETSITSGPAPTTGSNEATFEFSATESGSSFACQLDGAGSIACSSPTTLAGLVAGSHTLLVRATDSAGNTDQSPAAWSWAIVQASSPGITQPPAAGVSADSTPPVLSVRARSSQRFGKQKGVVVRVGCPAEDCIATARGTISFAAIAKTVNLKPARSRIPKGGSATLKLRLSKARSAAFNRALKKRKTGRAKITVTVTDTAGNAARERVGIRLRG